MASNVKWKALEHSQSKQKGQGKHVILAAYKPKGSRMNTVIGVAPLYDMRDANLDGSVTVLERFYGGGLYDPYYVFKLMNSAGKASCVADAAIQLRDWELYGKAIGGFLQDAHKVCQQALVAIMVEKAISPGIELNLANTGLANLGAFSDYAQFIVQTALEEVIIASISR